MPDSIFDLKQAVADAKAKVKSLKGSSDPLAVNAANFDLRNAEYRLEVAQRRLKGK